MSRKNYADGFESEMLEWIRDNPNGDPTDYINELADSAVPVYYGELFDAVEEDFYLATKECEIPAYDGRATAVNIIAGNYYQFTVEDLWEFYEDHRDDYFDEKEGDEDDFVEDEDDEDIEI